MTTLPPKLNQAIVAIQSHLQTRDMTNLEIIKNTNFPAPVISQAMKSLAEKHKIHICEYRQAGYRFLKVFRIGRGTDAVKPENNLAITERIQPLLEQLRSGDMTRAQLTAALDWSATTTADMLRYMRDHDLVHIGSFFVNANRKEIPIYRAGAGADAVSSPSRKPAVSVRHHAVPKRDPLMAALFGPAA